MPTVKELRKALKIFPPNYKVVIRRTEVDYRWDGVVDTVRREIKAETASVELIPGSVSDDYNEVYLVEVPSSRRIKKEE